MLILNKGEKRMRKVLKLVIIVALLAFIVGFVKWYLTRYDADCLKELSIYRNGKIAISMNDWSVNGKDIPRSDALDVLVENTLIPYVVENSNAEKVDKSYDWSVEIKYDKGSSKEVAVYVVNSNNKEPEFINKILEYIKQYK